MIPIKELTEVPTVKIFIVISIITFAVFPNMIYVYSIDKELFVNLDFWKLFMLTTGFGLTVAIVNTIITFYILLIHDLFSREKILKKLDIIFSILLGTVMTFLAHAIFSIQLVMFPYLTKLNFIPQVNTLENGIIRFWICEIISGLILILSLVLKNYILKWIRKKARYIKVS